MLCTFFRSLALFYQTDVDTASEENFNTKNPEQDVRLIENLASRNNTKNTDYERKKSAKSFEISQMTKIKAKLGRVHNLLVVKKQVYFQQR